MYTVDYFIRKFEAIPDVKWIVGHQGVTFGGSGCALGHCRMNGRDGYGGDTVEGEALKLLFIDAGIFYENTTVIHGVAWVNNGGHKNYQQETPKARILAALYDIKAMQQPVHEDITASLAVLPVSETSDVITKPVLS